MGRSGSERAAGNRTATTIVIHLDTSFAIRALIRGTTEDKRLRTWLTRGEDVVVSAVAWTEFLCGPLEEADLVLAVELFGVPSPFRDVEGELAARLFNESGRRRGTLIDCMVGAAALAAGAPLATSNPADFRRFAAAGLQVIAAKE